MTSDRDVIYPYTDYTNTVWVDPSGFLVDRLRPCFICKKPTLRVDIDFEAPYCNSYVCEVSIYMDLDERTVFDEPHPKSR